MNLCKPIQVGPVTLENNVILAPMSGVTDMPFRQVVKRQGSALVISEMIASQAMIRHTRQSLQMAQKSPEEYPMSVQLAGCEPEVMAEAARLNEDLGADIIDINMGCPVKKVVGGHAGSALMRDLVHAGKILDATVRAVKIPVTLKMRTGWDDNTRNAPELAKIAEDCGIQMVTVHGRTRCQLYHGRADWAFIRQVKDVVKIPVIGNGDVVTVEDAKTLLEMSGADGVMVGRGIYGRPWFLNQIVHYLKTAEHLSDPSLWHQYLLIKAHLDAMIDHYGEMTAVRIARKHLGWYSKGLHGSTDFRVLINQGDSAETLHRIIDDFYLPLLEDAPI